MKRFSFTLLTITFAVALAASLGATTTFAATPNYTKLNIKEGPRHRLYNSTSSNWAGYAVETNLTNPQNNAVSDASGQWIVPTLTCNGRSTSYSASWVGIDGYSSNTVEQTGSMHECNRGRAQYYAWFEFYPQYMYQINLTIHPGNVMSADVKYVGNSEFTVTLSDITTSRSFTITEFVPGAAQSSAEWIEEAPSTYYGVLPLANFGTESFSHASATVNGTTGTISNSSWQNDPISMLEYFNGPSKATTSALSTDGSSFNVTWQHN